MSPTPISDPNSRHRGELAGILFVHGLDAVLAAACEIWEADEMLARSGYEETTQRTG